VVVIIVAGLYVVGVGPFSKVGSASTPPADELTFKEAAAVAAPVTPGVPGGPWTVYGGGGIQSPVSVPLGASQLAATFRIAGCPGTLLSGSSTVGSVPASTSLGSSGRSAAWVIDFINAAGETLRVAVYGGVATPVLEYKGEAGCSPEATVGGLPASYVDSPTSASTAFAAGGSTFAAAHASIDVENLLVPQITITGSGTPATTPAEWRVTLTTCNLADPTGATLGGTSPAWFDAVVNASDGQLVSAQNLTTACPVVTGSTGNTTTTSLPEHTSDFEMFQVHVGNSFWNNGTFLNNATAYGIPVGDLVVSIENSTTGAAVPTTGFTLAIVVTGSSYVLSAYSFGTNTWNVTEAYTGQPADHNGLALETPGSMSGEKIVLSASPAAPFTGSVSARLGVATV
jgi:hypothetical protein